MTDLSDYHLSDHTAYMAVQNLRAAIKVAEGEYIITGNEDTYQLIARAKRRLAQLEYERASEYETMTTCADCNRDLPFSQTKWTPRGYVCRGGCDS